MKVVVLSRNRKLYSTRRLAEACALRGHEVEVINHLKCYVDIASNRPSVHYGDERLPVYDAVIPRIGSTVTEYGTAVLRQFEMMGTYPLNESVAISRARNSLRSLQLLARGGIGLPLTGFRLLNREHSGADQDRGRSTAGVEVVAEFPGQGSVPGRDGTGRANTDRCVSRA